MCGGGPPPGTSCDSTALTTPPVSRPWMRMTIGMPRTLTFLPPSLVTWTGVISDMLVELEVQGNPKHTPRVVPHCAGVLEVEAVRYGAGFPCDEDSRRQPPSLRASAAGAAFGGRGNQ